MFNLDQAPLAGSDIYSYDVSSLDQTNGAAAGATGVAATNRDFVLINCSGSQFEVSRLVFQKYPQVLAGIHQDGIRRRVASGRIEFFFDRDPELFRYVLMYCRYGEMHVPNHICGPLLEREMSAWGVPFGVDLQVCTRSGLAVSAQVY